jgi:hypothetical protein
MNNYDREINRIPIIGLLQAGTLRKCLHLRDQNFNEVLPWPNTLVLLKIKGSLIRKMLQHENETAPGAICGFVGGTIAFLFAYPAYTLFVREHKQT